MKRLVRGLLPLLLLGWSSAAGADPTLRLQVSQKGDFVLFGNTLGRDCNSEVPAPVVGTVGDCGNAISDTAPDTFWRSDAPGAGQATTTFTVADARSTAVLQLPAGAVITYARLYWAAQADTATPANTGTLERPGASTHAITADTLVVTPKPGQPDVHWYQGTAEVTAIVQALGPGPYRFGGIDSVSLQNFSSPDPIAAWSIVVFYELGTDPKRQLTIFDGLDAITGGNPATVSLSGFLVPMAGFDAKLGVVTYEGDHRITGDSLIWDGTSLSNPLNPVNNFFNGTRSFLGNPVSNVGDLPQLTGGADSMSGVDMDVVEVTSLVGPGQTSATIQATSSGDAYLLGLFVTSISTLTPDFSQSTKQATDVNGGAVFQGDVIEYTIIARNTGFDAAVGTVVTDTLPPEVEFVPGTINISAGPNAGPKTDGAGDDQAEYDPATRTVTVRIGTGADATQGGTVPIGDSTTITLRVVLDQEVSTPIVNQAIINASGERGSAAADFPTDGDLGIDGSQPTVTFIDECATDAQCGGALGHCATAPTPNVCVACLLNAHCPAERPLCDLGTNTCVPCTGDGAPSCPDPAHPACQAAGAALAGRCTECSATNASLCGGDKPICLADQGVCGCTDTDGDSECGATDSGRICSGPSGSCVDGCSTATGRNGCPASQRCSDQTGGVGTCLDFFCNGDGDCNTPPALRCDLAANPPVCVQCLGDGDCTSPQVCDVGGTRRCVECTSTQAQNCSAAGNGAACLANGSCGCTTDAECGPADSGRVCNTATSRCITGCRGTGGNSCPPPMVCTSTTTGIGECVGCLDNSQCSGGTPFCEPTSRTCIGCVSDGTPSCPDPARPSCQSSGPLVGQCTECSASNASRCGGARPICLIDTGTCGCTDTDGDSECGAPTSGLVCSGAAGACVEGCSTTPGRNGCPTGQVCSELGGAVGTCVTQGCTTDAECAAPLGRCDTAASPPACVACLADADCGGPSSGRACHVPNHTCREGCRGSGGNGCPAGTTCTSSDTTIGECLPDEDGGMVGDGGTSSDGGVPGDGGTSNDGGPPPSCDNGCDDGNTCTADRCDDETNHCAFVPVPDGTPCGGSGICRGGACVQLRITGRGCSAAGGGGSLGWLLLGMLALLGRRRG